MYLDKQTILESLTCEDIINICKHFGSDYKKDTNGYIFNTSICHKDGNSWKLYYYPKDAHFHCYTCSETYDIIYLVIRANALIGQTITWYNALKWIGIFTNKLSVIDTEELATKNENLSHWENAFNFDLLKKTYNIPTLKEYNHHVLDLFKNEPITIWEDEGISRNTNTMFEIGYCTFQNCITIPVRDMYGRLIGVRGRFMLEQDIEEKGKYRPLFINGQILKFNSGETFYGICQNQAAIKKAKKVFLFEAEKSVLLNHTFYGDNDISLAVLGSNLTSTQIRILIEYLKVTHVIIAFDKEYHTSDSFEAEIYYNKLLKKIAPLIQFCQVELVLDRQDLLSYKDAPVDLGFDIWTQLLQDKITVTQADIDLLKEKERKKVGN